MCGQSIVNNLRIIKDANKGLYRAMSKLEIMCRTEKVRKGNIGSLEEHLGKCDFYPIKCRIGCGKIVIRKDLDLHEKNECEHRQVSCKFCYKTIKICELKVHVDSCEKNPNRFRKCKFFLIGCTYENRGEAIKRHENEANKEHLELAMKKLEVFGVKMS